MFVKNNLDNLSQNIKLGLKYTMNIVHDHLWYEEKTKTEYTLWNMTSGIAYITIENITYTAKEGDIVIFSPGIKHAAQSDNDGCEFLMQKFSIEQGNDIDILANSNIAGIIPGKYAASLCAGYCNEMRPSIYNGISINTYAAFLSYFCKLIKFIQSDMYIPFIIDSQNTSHTNMHNAMTYISEHFNENISIKEVAEETGFSEKYFINQFKQMLGIPPKQYLIQCRMQHASHMLIHSDCPISDIALDVGYTDVYSFSKAFRKYFDQPPSEFRKNHSY